MILLDLKIFTVELIIKINSNIHSEAFPAGELKHGPIALIDDNMPVIAIAPNDDLLEKLL